MNVIIDGIEYQPVEQKVDQEREDVIADMEDIYYTGEWERNRFGKLYDADYRKVGEAITQEELEKFRAERKGLSYINVIDELRSQYTITKKVEK